MEFQNILVSADQVWYSGGYHYSIPNAFVPSRYKLTPLDGAYPLADGCHKGFIVKENVLRIVYGGEYHFGSMINFEFSDYKVEFMQKECDDYCKGLERGYHGKRGASDSFRFKQNYEWNQGYREGRRAKNIANNATNQTCEQL